MIHNSPLGVVLFWIGIIWTTYAAGCYRTGMADPVEAKAKAVMSTNFSLGVLATLIDISIAIFFFVNGFVMYFWAKSYFRNSRQ